MNQKPQSSKLKIDAATCASTHKSRFGTLNPEPSTHIPQLQTEKTRIEKANGFVEDKRVNGTLAVARAMGDFSFKQEKTLSAEEQQVMIYYKIAKECYHGTFLQVP